MQSLKVYVAALAWVGSLVGFTLAAESPAFALGKRPRVESLRPENESAPLPGIESTSPVSPPVFEFPAAPRVTRETVATVTTDAFDGVYKMDVTRDETGKVLTLVYVTEKEGEKTFAIDLLKTGFQVLKTQSGRDAVLMKVAPNFDAAKGGYGVIRVLHSGLSGSYMNFRILVDVDAKITLRSDPDTTDRESDRNPYTGPFNTLFMKKNTFLGMTVGIDEIRPALK